MSDIRSASSMSRSKSIPQSNVLLKEFSLSLYITGLPASNSYLGVVLNKRSNIVLSFMNTFGSIRTYSTVLYIILFITLRLVSRFSRFRPTGTAGDLYIAF